MRPASAKILSTAAWAARVLPQPVKDNLYRIKPVAGLLRNVLNRAAPTGLTQVTVAAGALAGMRLVLDMQTEKDYWLGTYEPQLQSAILDFVRPGKVAYDVGANIGYISLLLAKTVGQQGHVFSFEALPANIERMRQNVSLNQMEARISVIDRAVSDSEDPVNFLTSPSGGMGRVEGSVGRQISPTGSLPVAGTSLDHFVYQEGNPPPEILKMDIEGGETRALPGMSRILLEDHPIVLLELHGPDATQIAWDILEKTGYHLYLMNTKYPPIRGVDELDWKSYIVALHETSERGRSWKI
jgi:FkbM family methyltransferase